MLIYSYNPYSRSAKNLAQALGIKRIKHTRSKFSAKRQPTVINWGATELPAWRKNARILNEAEHVRIASNKLEFFKAADGADAPLVPWTTDPELAKNWMQGGKHSVCARTVLAGHSGDGLILVGPGDPLPVAPLYTKYIKKSEEFRVHVFGEEVIDIQRKGRRRDIPDDEVNWQIRNHANGFIYMRERVETPKLVATVALSVMGRLPLLFGAVDVIYNAKHNMAYVLEVNTAPGLEGTTVKSYARTFERYK